MSEEQNIPEEEPIGNEPARITLSDGQLAGNVVRNAAFDPGIQTSPSDSYRNQLQTENMEVHKHPHHVTHKKKWGEYVH